MAEQLLAGQVALVTGANSGIGEGIARALGGAGAAVAVNYLENRAAAERVARGIEEAGGRAMTVQADVTAEEKVREMFLEVIARFERIDILVSNAGVQDGAPLPELTLEQWRRVVEVNLTGGFLCAREAARHFLRQGPAPHSKAAGKIIFISSVHEAIPWGGEANYAASKGGLMLFMKSIAQELAPRRIRVNAIGPGAIRTGLNRRDWERTADREAGTKLIACGRWGEVADIAPAAVWLASDDSDYVVGTTLFIDGGMLLYPEHGRGVEG